MESQLINFDSHESLSYSLPISTTELHSTIHKNLRNNSSGLGNIRAALIKNLHPNTLSYLLISSNDILLQNICPTKWKLTIMRPTWKPSEDPSSPDPYRPIALTSVLEQFFKRSSIKDSFGSWNLTTFPPPFQYSFQKGSNTRQPRTDLHQQIRMNNQCQLAPLYNIFRPCPSLSPFASADTMYISTIMRSKTKWEPKSLQSFLYDRVING